MPWRPSMSPGLCQYHMMPNIMPIYNAAPMAKTEFGKVIGRKMMALTSSDQCGDARSRPALKKASDSAAESCVDDRRPDFCATGFIDMEKSPPTRSCP